MSAFENEPPPAAMTECDQAPPAPSPRRPRTLWIIFTLFFVAIGGAISGYSLWRYWEVDSGVGGGMNYCQVAFGVDCDDALQSEWGTLLGIPLGGWGVMHYAALATLLVLCVVLGESFAETGFVAFLLLAMLAALFGLAMLAAMLTGLVPLCPLCLGIHGVAILLVPLGWHASGLRPGEIVAALRSGLRYLFGGRAADPALARWRIVGLVAAALAGLVAYQWTTLQAYRSTARALLPSISEAIAEYEAEPQLEIPYRESAPRLGPSTAEVEIVVFSDFACPACRQFAETVRKVQRRHPEEVSVVFLHYPLSPACNAAVRSDSHPLSCAAANAAEAAHQQQQFWAYHDALFNSPEKLEEAQLVALAASIDLDPNRFEHDRTATAISEAIAADTELGAALQVNGTPTIFLNGRELGSAGRKFLNELIDHELAK